MSKAQMQRTSMYTNDSRQSHVHTTLPARHVCWLPLDTYSKDSFVRCKSMQPHCLLVPSTTCSRSAAQAYSGQSTCADPGVTAQQYQAHFVATVASWPALMLALCCPLPAVLQDKRGSARGGGDSDAGPAGAAAAADEDVGMGDNADGAMNRGGEAMTSSAATANGHRTAAADGSGLRDAVAGGMGGYGGGGAAKAQPSPASCGAPGAMSGAEAHGLPAVTPAPLDKPGACSGPDRQDPLHGHLAATMAVQASGGDASGHEVGEAAAKRARRE
jgi:hypothetical protein